MASRGGARARRDPPADLSARDSVGSVAFAGTTLAVGCGQREHTAVACRPAAATATRGATLTSRSSCDSVASVAFAADGDGKTLAVGCGNGKTLLWNVAAAATRGAPLANLAACDSVYNVAFAPEGTSRSRPAPCRPQREDAGLERCALDERRRPPAPGLRPRLAKPDRTEWRTLAPGLPYRASSCPS